MENQPKFIREFSKQSPEERQKAAREIKAKRAEAAAERRRKSEREVELERQEQALRGLERRLEELTANGLETVEEGFEANRIRAEIALGKKTYEELKTEAGDSPAGSAEGPAGEDGARQLLKRFYTEQKEKWANSGFTPEDVRKYLSEEHLASLPLEDYVALLRRFPNEMVTHVTRQGVRDHTGHAFHNAGENQFVDGFKNIARDGRLRSALGIKMVEGMKAEAVDKFLDLGRFKSRQEALGFLHALTRPKEAPGSYADIAAVHFAAEEVADAFYGSEKGNEIFFAFPSAHVSSQYFFTGRLDKAGGGYWNDQWVYANEERGMDIDAGLVFIPESARVDPATGSRYKLDAEGRPVKNERAIASIDDFIASPDFEKFSDEAKKLIAEASRSQMPKVLRMLGSKLAQEFGLKDERLQAAVLDYQFLSAMEIAKARLPLGGYDEEEARERISADIEGALKSQGIFFEEAEDAVSSKEYWEKYFSDNPDKRPSKIVYYRGQDPTAALHRWREENGLLKTVDDVGVRLDGKKVGVKSPEANPGMDRFESLAMEAIDRHFGPEPPPDDEDVPPPDTEDTPPPDEDGPPPDLEDVPPPDDEDVPPPDTEDIPPPDEDVPPPDN